MEVETHNLNPIEVIDSTYNIENSRKQLDIPSLQALEDPKGQQSRSSDSRSSDSYFEIKKEKERAYAVIKKEDKTIFYVQSREIFIGRILYEDDLVMEKKDSQLFQICKSDKVSRLSARIFWSNESKCWYIQKISKNAIYVDKQLISTIGSSFPLSFISAIQIHKTRFYFSQAYISSD